MRWCLVDEDEEEKEQEFELERNTSRLGHDSDEDFKDEYDFNEDHGWYIYQ